MFDGNKNERNQAKRIEVFKRDLFEVGVFFYILGKRNVVWAVSPEDPGRHCQLTFSDLFDQEVTRRKIAKISYFVMPLMGDAEYIELVQEILAKAREIPFAEKTLSASQRSNPF